MDDTRTLSIREAAERLGISEATVRRWIRSSRLQASKRGMPGGYEWRIYLPDQEGDDHTLITSDHRSSSIDQPPTKDDQHTVTKQHTPISDRFSVPDDPSSISDEGGIISTDQPPNAEYAALLGAYKELQQQNLQLAGRIGWLESKLQDAEEQIRLLTAEAKAPEMTEPEPEVKQPWWKRIFS